MINSRHGNLNDRGSSHLCSDPVKARHTTSASSNHHHHHHHHHHHSGGIAEFVASKTRNIFNVGGKRRSPTRTDSESSTRSARSTSTEYTATTVSSTSTGTDCDFFFPEKRVNFAGKVCVRKIPTLAQYSEQEKIDCWFTDEEYARISNDCIKHIRRLDSGETFKGTKYCPRGIEHHTRLGSVVRLKNRSTSIQAVLDEQERQCMEGEQYNDRKISNAYSRCASSSQLWAQAIGLRDMKEAEAVCFDDDDDEINFCDSSPSDEPTLLESSCEKSVEDVPSPAVGGLGTIAFSRHRAYTAISA